jgi:hypothetical protein
VAIAHHLNLDMPGIVDILLDQQAVVAECGLGFALGADNRGGELWRRANDAHTTSSVTGGRLHQHGKTDLLGGARQCRLVLRLAMIARYQRHPGSFHQRLRTGFGSHRGHHLGRRADEHEPCGRAHLRKFGVFRQKSIAGMNRLRARLTRRLDDAFDIEIAVTCPRGAKQHCVISHRDMHRAAIGFRIDLNSAQAHRARGTDHAGCDLTAIGDQERAKAPVHPSPIHGHILNRPNLVGSIGVFDAADSPSPSTSRVSAGSVTPSSQRRAVA